MAEILWILLIVLFSTVSSKLYHVAPVNGTSHCQVYPENTCFTLDKLQHQFKDGLISGDNTLHFMSGDHVLTWRLHFEGTGGVTLQNSEQLGTNDTPVITCFTNSGIDVNITGNFTIRGLVFKGDEVARDENMLSVISALITTIVQSGFFGINSKKAVVYFSETILQISNCRFINNSAPNGSTVFLNTDISIVENSYFRGNRGLNGGAIGLPLYQKELYILESIFYNNSAAYIGGAVFTLSSLYSKVNVYKSNRADGLGGAVFTTSVDKPILFEDDLFVQNIAPDVAALYILETEGSVANISNCTISKNIAGHADYTSVVKSDGAKLNLNGPVLFERNIGALYSIDSEVSVYDRIVFKNNVGTNGGAMAFVKSTLKFGYAQTVITENKAMFGAGIYLDHSTVKGERTKLEITGNTAKSNGGGIYSFESQIVFASTVSLSSLVNISNNSADTGGGLYLTTTSLQLSSTYFAVENNAAHQFGGGAYLERESRMKLTTFDDSIFCGSVSNLLVFTNNSAVKGGALFVTDSVNGKLTCDRILVPSRAEIITKQCFLQTETDRPTKIAVIFNYNTATHTGGDIYGGLLDRCTIISSEEGTFQTHGNGLQYLQTIGGFSWSYRKFFLSVCNDYFNTSLYTTYGRIKNEYEFHDHVSSDPMRVCFCVNNTVDCGYTHPTVVVRKGQEFRLSLAAVDQTKTPVKATLLSTLLFEHEEKGRLNEGQQSIKLLEKCTKVKYNIFSSTFQVLLELYADGPCGNKGMSKQVVNVSFEPCTCPIGLERYPPYIECVCDCNKELRKNIQISNCNAANKTIQLNQDIWIKYLNYTNSTAKFIPESCPFDYCMKKPLNINLANSLDINKQCAFNRTGLLCGKCAQGLSMVFANSQCRPCSNYYLFLLLPFGLAGIALVAFILLLNITVATGTIHGLIFYANIITANHSVFLPFGTPNLLTVFVSWLNLDLGIETCFYDGMDSYGKLMLQLVFPAYVFFLIATIMVLRDRSQRIAHLFDKRNPEATLYTLFLLSYSKLIRTIITALQFATLDYPDGSQEIVWLYDANVRYFALNHIPRFLAAFIITILGAVYTSLLLFGQLFNRFSEYRLMKWTSHKYYIHFLKANHAPLSDKHRYWVGLLLLARLTHYLVSAFADKFWVVLSVLVITLLFLMHKTVFKSYARKDLNVLEVLFMTNLIVLAGATLYVQVSGGNQQALAIVSMSISFIGFLGIVFYHILDSCGVKFKILSKLRKRRDIDRPAALFELNNDNAEEDHESDEELIDISNAPEDTATNEPYDPSRYITPPIIRPALPDDQLREPLMDDSPLTPADYNPQPVIRQIKQAPTVSEIVVRY